MSAGHRTLIDDCFVHDGQRMRHDDVLALLAERLGPVTGTATVPVIGAQGRIVAEPVTAPGPVPRSDNAAVDGYAFAHAAYLETSGRLPVCGRVAAGATAPEPVPAGHCARIFTGAPMPANTDTVAMQEDCTILDDGAIAVPGGLKAGANRRRAGEDFMQGDPVVRAGQTLRAQDLAALAATGYGAVAVRETLRVAILSTGDEIVPPGVDASAAQVHDANRPMLLALAGQAATEVTDLGHVGDDADALRTTLANAASGHDLIITSGGASLGEEDHMLGVLEGLGKRHLWQIAIKPGRPMMFGQIGDTVVLGLPGNPVAVLVCFLLYARPVIGHLGGATVTPPRAYALPAAFAIERKKTGRREFLRGWAETEPETGTLRAHKFPRDGSGLVSGLQAAQGLIDLPEDVGAVAPGDTVRFIPFSEMGLTTGWGSSA
ncbi:MAG: molybdopterin molybdotransferase MoeA [Roseitalea sp.]|jgi:molybdopterin molybdotransferase|nr:molybdopterin molybdotransferase MoeA [Roseitalea sp.]MBO6722643.1 molybdopterin molybdotransferase MoeA [Roseitalea sp.]MBO6741573.1 molybdopterin molybdotransferase MoeA [Roseitalea sp.]